MASKRRVKKRECIGKVRYLTKKEASEALNRMISQGHAENKRLVVYVCSFCGYRHIGHENAKRKASRLLFQD